MSSATSTPVPPMRVHSRAGTPVQQDAPYRIDTSDTAGEGTRPRRAGSAHSDGHVMHCIDRPLGVRVASRPSSSVDSMSARSSPHTHKNASHGAARGKLDFSQNLELWKALESPRLHESSSAYRQAPQPSPRRESLSLTPNRKQTKPDQNASTRQEAAPEDQPAGPPWPRAGTRHGNSLPYAYGFATSAQPQGRDRRVDARELDESRKDVDAATALGNVWSGSSRAVRKAEENDALQRRAMPMNMVGAFEQASARARTNAAPAAEPLSNCPRATWSEGTGVAPGNTEPRVESAHAVRTALWLSRLSSSSVGGLEPQVSGDIGPFRPARVRQASDGFYRVEEPAESEDGRRLSRVTASTVCESPGLAMLRSSQARPTSSFFGVFTSKLDSSASDGLDMFSMRAELLQRRELLQSADRNKSAKTKNNAADLPHIGPSTHSLLSLPHNASSQLAAAAAMAGDYNAWKRTRSSDSGDQSQDCREAKTPALLAGDKGDDVPRKLCREEPPKSDAQTLCLDSARVLEWFCTRKHKKYSLHRKSRLLLIVDGAGRLRLSRGSQMLNSIENTNPTDTQPLDTYGTPAAKGMRDSQGWITSAMQSLKRHHSPIKTRPRGGEASSPRSRSRAGDTSPWQASAFAHEGFLSEEEDLSAPSALVNTGDRSPTKNGDAALRLGGRHIRHMIDIECVTFKEKHSVKKKSDEGVFSDAAPSSAMRSKTKDVKQEDAGKGTLMIKFKDGSTLQLSGMQVQDVAGDLMKHVSIWSERCKNQTLTLDRLVVLAKTKVSWDKPAHREMLQSLWSAVYPDKSMPEPSLDVNVSPGWKDVGFQSNDPCTDFRAMGLLGLHCLCYHGLKYPNRVRTIVHAGRPARDFPYAAVGINLVAALVQMLKLGQQTMQPSAASGRHSQLETTALFDFLCKMPNDENIGGDASTRAGPLGVAASGGPSRGLEVHDDLTREHPYAFEETFCAAFEMLDDMWVEDPPANILFFNTLLQQCRGLLAQLFEKRGAFSLAELRADIQSHVPSSGDASCNSAQPSSNATASLFEPASNTSMSNSAANTSKTSGSNDRSSPSSLRPQAAQQPSSMEDCQSANGGEMAAAGDREQPKKSEQTDLQWMPPDERATRSSRSSMKSPASVPGQEDRVGQVEVDMAASEHKGDGNSINLKTSKSSPMLWAPDVVAPATCSVNINRHDSRPGLQRPSASGDDSGGNLTQTAASIKPEGKRPDGEKTIQCGANAADAGMAAVASLGPPVRLMLDTELSANTSKFATPPATTLQRPTDGAVQKSTHADRHMLTCGQDSPQLGACDARQHRLDGSVKSEGEDKTPRSARPISGVQTQGFQVSAGNGSRIVPPLVFSDSDRSQKVVVNVFDYPTARAGTPTNAQAIIMPESRHTHDLQSAKEGCGKVSGDATLNNRQHHRPAAVQPVPEPCKAPSWRGASPGAELSGWRESSPRQADDSLDGDDCMMLLGEVPLRAR